MMQRRSNNHNDNTIDDENINPNTKNLPLPSSLTTASTVVSSSSSSHATKKQRGKCRWMLPILSGTVLVLVIVQQNTISPFRTNVRKSSTTSNSRNAATPIPAAAPAAAKISSAVLGDDKVMFGKNTTPLLPGVAYKTTTPTPIPATATAAAITSSAELGDDKVVLGENTTPLLPGVAYTTPTQSSMIAKEKKTTTTTSSNNHLIIHVGPPKTGTSSIQCQLQVNPFLNSSNYVYLGQWQKRGCPRSLLKQKKPGVSYHKMRQVVHGELIKMRSNGAQSRALGKSLEELYARNYHAVLSSEAFHSYLDKGDDVWNFLASYTKQIPHKVTFVMTYRRYYEWFFSYHYFITDMNLPKEFQTVETALRFESPFYRMMRTGLDDGVDMQKGSKNNLYTDSPISYFTKFTKYFGTDNVVIFNMHGGERGDGMTSRFICDVLPESSKACQETTEDALKNPPPPINAAKSQDKVFGDRLANAAYQQGFFVQNGDGITRTFVRNSIIARVRTELGLTFQDLPSTCLSQTVQDSLLQKSIAYEHAILRKDANEERLTQTFIKYKQKNWNTLFCNPDEEAILRDTSWIQFFQNLTNPMPNPKN